MPFKNNPLLKTAPPSPDWEGTPVDDKGRFVNLTHPFRTSFYEVLKWRFQRNPFKKEKQSAYHPNINTDHSWLNNDKDCIVWLGHCTFFIRLNEVCFLTDPVYGNISLVKRSAAFPLDPGLLKGIHYVLLSHDHRDHCDKNSLRNVIFHNPAVKILSGLYMDGLIKGWAANAAIETAGWYQQFNTDQTGLSIYFVPSRHWAKRELFDTNRRLWGGFVIKKEGRSIYFGGDSGYDVHYKEAAATFGKFNYALLGIGAFEPQWFMHPNHQSPEEALKAFKDLAADRMIPMHYGVFDLSDEPLFFPLQQLQHFAKEHDLTEAILTPGMGEAVYL